MRKTIIITCLILSGLMILDSLQAPHALMMFLFAGVIPGTNIAVSASDMIFLFSLLTGFVLGRITQRFVAIARSHRPLQARA
jgi:hypothetical protein